MENKPLIDVIMPTYQGASRNYLRDAIESVLNQTYTHFRLLIINDGSTDHTVEICQQYSHLSHVQYYEKTNGGLASARNYGIKKSTASYLCFLDDDDLFEPFKLEKQVDFLGKNQNFGLLYTAVTHVNEKNTPIKTWYQPAHPNIYKQLFLGNFISAPSSVMIPRITFDELGTFDEKLPCCEDYDMWLRIAKNHPIYSLKEPLVRYRIHEGNMSKELEQMHTTKLSVINTALRSAPQEILNKKNTIYFSHYASCSAQYLGINQYNKYRENFKKAALYGKHPIKETAKYFITYSPLLFQTFKKIIRKFG